MNYAREIICQLETTVDHLTGEELGHALCALNDLQVVLDAVCLQGIGKKNRPVYLLQVLCKPGDETAVCAEIFRHTHTLGVRIHKTERVILPRAASQLELPGLTLPAKLYRLDERDYIRPEADAVLDFARKLDIGTPAIRFGMLVPRSSDKKE